MKSWFVKILHANIFVFIVFMINFGYYSISISSCYLFCQMFVHNSSLSKCLVYIMHIIYLPFTLLYHVWRNTAVELLHNFYIPLFSFYFVLAMKLSFVENLYFVYMCIYLQFIYLNQLTLI